MIDNDSIWPAALQDLQSLAAFCVIFPSSRGFDGGGGGPSGGVGDVILQEIGDVILQETGSFILQEQ